MALEVNRYGEQDLKEFEELIISKLTSARDLLETIKSSLNRLKDNGTDITSGSISTLEDGAEAAEKENLSQLAARQQKYVANLESALVRIKNGTYGVCVSTGKLISKERLRVVPHTLMSIEAKLKQNR